MQIKHADDTWLNSIFNLSHSKCEAKPSCCYLDTHILYFPDRTQQKLKCITMQKHIRLQTLLSWTEYYSANIHSIISAIT